MQYDEALEFAKDGIRETVLKRLDLMLARDNAAELIEGFVAGDIAFTVWEDCIFTSIYRPPDVPDDIGELDIEGW
ncbi:hypothetical protein GCM10010313_20560 [Streptomyces violarus]|uniref:Uncharacterized protein n=1 Tax=Streptomyces violarus TaxID=67380 RepID=A0A7W4ZN99_9ACTN|nr:MULTISPECIES: hypothetical protein [Streptomyces]MBB3075580.1 hypothetical protein [Streptomyces violarus]WRT98171.1 hypothetical protein VJ737_10955 [Streptomyces sp. CGMCC 4.1772]GHD04360.1 hypothetical protein GCM10010313_20560 [Streptomyces violarus]